MRKKMTERFAEGAEDVTTVIYMIYGDSWQQSGLFSHLELHSEQSSRPARIMRSGKPIIAA